MSTQEKESASSIKLETLINTFITAVPLNLAMPTLAALSCILIDNGSGSR